MNTSFFRMAFDNMRKAGALGALLGIVLLLASGCSTMSSNVAKSSVNAAPPVASQQAQIIFMRPSMLGGAIQSSVYEVKNDAEEFIGIVSAKTKTACNVPPGEHLFMVVGENADFMMANVDAGKTYYVLVAPRMGVMKARFSLIPIHSDPAAKYSLAGKDFADWNKGTEFVDQLDSARVWYKNNAASVASKRTSYLKDWNALPASTRAEITLLAKDGVASR